MVLVMMAAAVLANPATARTPRSFFGAVATGYPTGVELQQASSGGVDSVRSLFYWPEIAPEAGVRRWEPIDALVSDAASTGIKLLPVLYGTPHWASGDAKTLESLEVNRPPIYSPQSREAWAGFVTELVLRYGKDGSFWTLHPEVPKRPIRAWQLWNEVNLPFYWGGKPNPRRYGRFIRLTDRVLRKADPRAKLVLAGLLPYEGVTGGIISSEFLRRLYRVKGVRKAFDVVAIHPYAAHPPATVRHLHDTRKVLDSLGARKMPIWATEFGWTTGGDDFERSPFRTTELEQAHNVAKTYRMMKRSAKRLRLRRAYYFSLGDEDPRGTGSWQTRMGLFRLDGQPKPAWFAYIRLAGGGPY